MVLTRKPERMLSELRQLYQYYGDSRHAPGDEYALGHEAAQPLVSEWFISVRRTGIGR